MRIHRVTLQILSNGAPRGENVRPNLSMGMKIHSGLWLVILGSSNSHFSQFPCVAPPTSVSHYHNNLLII